MKIHIVNKYGNILQQNNQQNMGQIKRERVSESKGAKLLDFVMSLSEFHALIRVGALQAL